MGFLSFLTLLNLTMLIAIVTLLNKEKKQRDEQYSNIAKTVIDANEKFTENVKRMDKWVDSVNKQLEAYGFFEDSYIAKRHKSD